MGQHWKVLIGMKDEHQFMPEQVIEIPAPLVLTEDVLVGIYAYLDLVYSDIYYFSMDYAGAPVGGRGRVELFIEEGKIESIIYNEGYKYMCNKFEDANLKDRL